MHKPIIELTGITKDYHLGRTIVHALTGVDLRIGAGEFTVVLGPSGSGKSTLLNIIGCLDRATQGSYKLDGEEISNRDFNDLAEVRNRKIGFIFQSFNLIPVLNVIENIEFPMALRRDVPSAASMRERIRSLASEVGLESYLAHKPDELSGGQRQRVAIARALVTDPKLVLADEPTANLDSVTAQQIIDLMVRLNQEKGVTFIFATHDPRVVKHARRVVQIQDGKILSADQHAALAAAITPGISPERRPA